MRMALYITLGINNWHSYWYATTERTQEIMRMSKFDELGMDCTLSV